MVGDSAQLRDLDILTWSHQVTPAPLPSRDAAFFRLGNAPEQFLVAEVEGQVVGYVKLGRPTTLESASHVLQVQGLAVDPGHGRRGIGRALLTAAVKEASSRGARRLTLRVLGPNRAARALYESTGFVVEGVLPGEFKLGGVYVDDVLMGLALPVTGLD